VFKICTAIGVALRNVTQVWRPEPHQAKAVRGGPMSLLDHLCSVSMRHGHWEGSLAA